MADPLPALRNPGANGRHTTSGRWRLGLALALVPAVMWGALPIALKVVLQQMDGCTIAWYRFAGAAAVLWLTLSLRRTRPRPATLSPADLRLLVVASLGLAGNYLFWILGLSHISPASAGVVIQISPLFVAVGGLLVFGERVAPAQLGGFAALIVGLGLFSRDQLAALLANVGSYWLGAGLVLAAGFSWSFYALAQKQLLRVLPSAGIMVLVYTGAALTLWPGAHPGAVLALTPPRLWLLAFCIANTVIAYGALSEALDHLEAARVSAVLPLSPLFTLSFMALLTRFSPGHVAPERLTAAGFVGALLVVGGAITAAVAGRAPVPENQP